jgi:PAS domain S-box-containing protein
MLKRPHLPPRIPALGAYGYPLAGGLLVLVSGLLLPVWIARHSVHHSAATNTEVLLGTLVAFLTAGLLTAVLIMQRRRRNLLARAAEQFRLALESAPTGMLMADAAGRIVLVNARIENLFGYPREELLGQSLEMLVPERLRDGSSGDLRAVFLAEPRAADPQAPGEFYGRRKDGSELPVEIGRNPLATHDGAFVLGSITDISKRREDAARLRELNAQLAEQVQGRSDELRAAQRGLATILDALPSMIGYWDQYLTNQMTNRAYRELQAESARASENSPIPGPAPLIVHSHTHVLAALRGETVTYEHSLPARNGRGPRHLLVHLIPDIVEDDVAGFYMLAHDITEVTNSKLSLAALIRGNDGLLNTLNQHALVSVADGAGRIVDVNAAFCAISGYTREELLGQDHRIVSSGTHPQKFWRDMWMHAGRGEPWRAEVCNRARDGSLYWVDSIITPFFGLDGRISKYISIRFDITAHKESQRRLTESELFLQRVEQVSGVGGFMIDLASGSQRWTRQSYVIYDVEEGTPLTSDLIDGFLAAPDRERVQRALRAARENGIGYDIEMPIVTARERSIWIRTAGEVESADRVPARVIGAIEDITKRRAMEQQLRDAIATAERASNAKSEFLANMSHEIRTPLNAVIGLGYLLEQTTLSADQHQFLTKIQFAGRALLGVVNNVLDLSKIEAGEMSLEDEPFDLTELIRDIGQMLAPQATTKGIELIVQIPAALPHRLRGDSTRIRQILMNLLNNSIKFTESGQVNLDVSVTPDAQAELRLRCVVKDTGIGIEPEALAGLFTPFTQADASTTRRFGGTGLGLSIARRLVELMGGTIGVSSEVAVGSTFWCEIPLRVAESVEGLAVPQPALGVRILIGEAAGDRPDALGAKVRALGWTAAVAATGEELLSALRATAPADWPDVIVLDLQDAEAELPPLIARLERVRPESELPTMIVVTNPALSSDQPQPILANADAVLLRPVSSSALFNAINSAVWRHNNGRERLLHSTKLDEVHAQWLSGVRALVVDDSDINLEVARRILEKQGAFVASCRDGAAAVEHVRSHHSELDVVLMDIQMPVLDGNEATRCIRNELGLEQLPIIALTAGALVAERQRSVEAGVNDFVSKPFDPLTLIRKIRWLVEHARGAPIPLVVRDGGIAPHVAGGPLMPSIDAAVVQRMFGEDLSLFRSLLLRMSREYADLELASALELEDADARATLLARAHKLKGSAGMIGASRVMRLAGAAETALQAKRPTEAVARIFAQLATALTTLREEAAQFLERLPAAEVAADPTAGSRSGTALDGIAQLHALLERQDLAAVDALRAVSAELTEMLGAADSECLHTAVDNLDFRLGAKLLDRLLVNPPAAAAASEPAADRATANGRAHLSG